MRINYSSANVYMNKDQWNSVLLDGSIPLGEIERMIDNSYMFVMSKMNKKSVGDFNTLIM